MDSKTTSCSEVNLLTGGFFDEILKKNKCSIFVLTFCNAKSILHLRGE